MLLPIQNRCRTSRIFMAVMLCAALPAIGQQAVVPAQLTIEEAVNLAVAHNASLQKASLESRRVQADLIANRTKRYPSSTISGQGSQLITKPEITFAAGSLGTYPGTGPIPGTDTTITIPRNFTGVVSASVSQPITNQIKLHFQLKALELGVAGTRQDEEKQKLETIDSTRRAYYAVVEAQAEEDSARASVPLYRESLRLATEKTKQEAILTSELLRAKAQFVEAENTLNQAGDQFAESAEKLNDLMGRDVHTPFRVSIVAEVDDQSESEAALEARALQNRPDVKKAKLDVLKAEYDVRAKKAEYIPEISGSVSYYTTFNFGNTLPSNIGLAGLSLNWEPWDWGKKHQEIIQKRVQQDEAKVGSSATQRTAQMEVSNAWRQLQSARRQLGLSEANQFTARQNLQEIQEQAKHEEKLPKDLFQAQSDLASADSQREKALTNYWMARANIKKVTGEE